MSKRKLNKNKWTIDVSSDFCVVGYNPENADFDRPRGEIIREVFHLVATNDYGDRKVYGSFSSFEHAEQNIPHAPMIEMWNDTYPEYGSKAYMNYGEDMQMESESRQLEAERYGFDTRFGAF
jgi:hypothetical protein